MLETDKNIIVTFSSPEAAYLYGLGQSISNLSKTYQESMHKNGTIYIDSIKRVEHQIQCVHNNAMQVINKPKINLEK